MKGPFQEFSYRMQIQSLASLSSPWRTGYRLPYGYLDQPTVNR
jgi:hypothetical protein